MHSAPRPVAYDNSQLNASLIDDKVACAYWVDPEGHDYNLLSGKKQSSAELPTL